MQLLKHAVLPAVRAHGLLEGRPFQAALAEMHDGAEYRLVRAVNVSAACWPHIERAEELCAAAGLCRCWQPGRVDQHAQVARHM